MFTNQALIQHSDRLNNFAYKLTHNKTEAEDLLQATLLKAIEKKHLFQENTNLYSWVSKIMYNMFVTAYRRRTKFESQYDPEPYIAQQSISAPQDIQMEMRKVEDAIDRLSEEHKEIILLICIKGHSYASVSEMLQIPVGTVRSRLHRAREALQHAVDTPPAHAVLQTGSTTTGTALAA